jgi:hypothetical protein
VADDNLSPRSPRRQAHAAPDRSGSRGRLEDLIVGVENRGLNLTDERGRSRTGCRPEKTSLENRHRDFRGLLSRVFAAHAIDDRKHTHIRQKEQPIFVVFADEAGVGVPPTLRLPDFGSRYRPVSKRSRRAV